MWWWRCGHSNWQRNKRSWVSYPPVNAQWVEWLIKEFAEFEFPARETQWCYHFSKEIRCKTLSWRSLGVKCEWNINWNLGKTESIKNWCLKLCPARTTVRGLSSEQVPHSSRFIDQASICGEKKLGMPNSNTVLRKQKYSLATQTVNYGTLELRWDHAPSQDFI